MTSDLLTCPACRASNPAGANWCSQCFRPFAEDATGADPEVPAAAGEPAESTTAPDEPTSPDPEDDLEQALAEATALLIAEQGGADEPDEPTWTCRICDTPNPLAASACEVCETSIYDSFGAQEETREVQPERALRRALTFPGLGHAAFGYGGIAFVTGFLAAVSALTGLMLLFAGEVSGLLLLGVVVAVWAMSAYDVLRLLAGAPAPILRPRVLSVFGGLVILVILLTVAAAFSSGATRAPTG